MEQKKILKPHHGIIIFIIMMILFITIGTVLQYMYGIYGLAATEILFLLLAVCSAVIIKADLKAAFSLRFPSIRSFFIGISLYSAVYLAILTVFSLISRYLPDISNSGEALVSMGKGVSPLESLVIIALLPAICEEAMFRGILLSCFKGLKYKAVAVLISALMFGFVHLAPYQFINSVLMGTLFSIIVIKTDSILLPVLFHFINNAISVYVMLTFTA